MIKFVNSLTNEIIANIEVGATSEEEDKIELLNDVDYFMFDDVEIRDKHTNDIVMKILGDEILIPKDYKLIFED